MARRTGTAGLPPGFNHGRAPLPKPYTHQARKAGQGSAIVGVRASKGRRATWSKRAVSAPSQDDISATLAQPQGPGRPSPRKAEAGSPAIAAVCSHRHEAIEESCSDGTAAATRVGQTPPAHAPLSQVAHNTQRLAGPPSLMPLRGRCRGGPGRCHPMQMPAQ